MYKKLYHLLLLRYTAEPITIRSDIRRVIAKNVLITVFVSSTTRAIYLKPVENLTSATFFATLRCFIAWWGKVAKIYNNSVTNFTVTQRELANLVSKGWWSDGKWGNNWVEIYTTSFSTFWKTVGERGEKHQTPFKMNLRRT